MAARCLPHLPVERSRVGSTRDDRVIDVASPDFHPLAGKATRPEQPHRRDAAAAAVGHACWKIVSTVLAKIGAVMFDPSSRGRLTQYDLGRFPGETLFDRLGRALCAAECLPRKELYESWEVARRVRRLCRGGRVVDLGAGHGLLAHILLILDNSSPAALVVDPALPPSTAPVHDALLRVWPRLTGRVRFIADSLDTIDLTPTDLVVSSHACGALTDCVIDAAATAGARLAVLPCCHHLGACDPGGFAGWLDPSLAIDVRRAVRLEARGYRVWTQQIPMEITPKNRLLIAVPSTTAA
jgi:hypothetical protein